MMTCCRLPSARVLNRCADQVIGLQGVGETIKARGCLHFPPVGLGGHDRGEIRHWRGGRGAAACWRQIKSPRPRRARVRGQPRLKRLWRVRDGRGGCRRFGFFAVDQQPGESAEQQRRHAKDGIAGGIVPGVTNVHAPVGQQRQRERTEKFMASARGAASTMTATRDHGRPHERRGKKETREHAGDQLRTPLHASSTPTVEPASSMRLPSRMAAIPNKCSVASTERVTQSCRLSVRCI